MSGHTNRNRRNGGNSRSRHGPQRQRGSDGRPGQPKSGPPPSSGQAAQQKAQPDTPASAAPPGKERSRAPQPPAQPGPPATPEGHDQSGQSSEAGNVAPPDEAAPPEHHASANARSRPPFPPAMRGSHAYIPASGPRPGLNGQNGHRSVNGQPPTERRTGPPVPASESDEGEGDAAGAIPTVWRIERLNGGTDTTPREPHRPESRGEVGPLIDSLHDLFARDRTIASQGDGVRCGICYLHFPVGELEYREAEGFFVCSGCKRALGYEHLMMVRRQQPPHGG